MTDLATTIARLANAGLGATDPGLRRHALEQIAALTSSPTTAAAAAAAGPLLIVTRGLPGSGKTTWARAWVAAAPGRRARLNRDDVRAMLHGRRLATTEQEAMVTSVQHAGIRALLDAGVDVVADDTNLSDAAIAAFAELAAHAGARLQIQDLTGVPVDECVRRDAQRTGPARLGEETIRRIHAEHAGSRRP
jgi:predicted kinase